MRNTSLVIVSVLVALPCTAQKVPDTRVDHGNASASGPRIAAFGSTICVVWADTRNGKPDIYANRSVDGGGSWLVADVRLDTMGAAGTEESSLPRVTTDGATFHAVWQERRTFFCGQINCYHDPDVYFSRSTDAGRSWLSSSIRLDAGLPRSGLLPVNPRLAVSGSNVYVTWNAQENGFDTDVFFNGSSDDGSTWSGQRRIDRAPSSQNSWAPVIAASGSAVYVAWEDHRNPAQREIYFNRSLDGGASWAVPDVRLGGSGTSPANLGVSDVQIAAAGQAVYVVWRTTAGGAADLLLNRSLDGGATWLATPVRIDTGTPPGATDSRHPRIAAGGSAVYVAWEDDRNGLGDILFNGSLDRGDTWLPAPLRLDRDAPGAAASTKPAIVADGSMVYVAWEDLRNGASDIYLNLSWQRGRVWRDRDVRLDTGSTPGAAGSRTPALASTASTVYASWTDDRQPPAKVFFNLPFGFQTYGPGTAGSGGILPTLRGEGLAAITSTVTLRLAQGLGGATGALLAGGPGSKTSSPLLGGTVLVVPAVAVPVQLQGPPGVAGAGTLAFPLDVPSGASGVDVYFQAVMLDAGGPFGVAMSNGLEMWIL